MVLAGAATGAAALAVRQLAGPGAAQAADGDIVTVGSSFEGTTTTAIRNTTNANPVLQGATKTGTGVWGVSDSGTGVEGFSTTGSGVYAESDQWIGVIGKSSGTAFPAIGVLGESNDAAGQGVFGQSESGTGVMGTSTSGVAVVAKANGPDAVALATQGPVQFSSAGRGTIPAKASSATVPSPVPLDAEGTKILVTLLDTGDDGSKKKHGKPSWKTPVWLSHVELDPEEGTFDVVLSGPTREEIGFSYLVIS
ncbi:MAG TPA: hypothetical protein VH721_01305 [Gaiellaceae bacterium]